MLKLIDENMEVVYYYEDQKTIHYYDMKIRENYVILGKYTEEKRATVREETKEEVMKMVEVGKWHWWKHRRAQSQHYYYDITTEYITSKWACNGELEEVKTEYETRMRI